MQEKYKIGDIVKVRSDLKGNTKYYYDGSDTEFLTLTCKNSVAMHIKS
jgi:hypothetical protein